MASFDYDAIQATARELLEMFGNPFTLRKLKGSVYNAETKKKENEYEDFTGICVMKNYTAEMVGALANIINMGDVSFVCQFDDKNVKATEGKDKIIFNEIEYNILNVSTSNPSGDKPLVHTLYARRVK